MKLQKQYTFLFKHFYSSAHRIGSIKQIMSTVFYFSTYLFIQEILIYFYGRLVVARGTFHLATIFRLKFRKFSLSKGKAQFPCGGNTCNLTGRSKHLARWRKTGCGHTTELNRGLASKSRLTSKHDLAYNRDLKYF